VSLFLVDLDDTLIDRKAAFAAWASSFVDRHRLPQGSLEWLLENDFGRGTVTVNGFFNWVTSRYGLPFSRDELLANFLEEFVSYFPPLTVETREALTRLRARGWKIAIVSNGSTSLQLRKLDVTGVIPLVDAWCVSEEAGVRKPEPAIFELAAERCASDLIGGWMVGDSAEADIAGGQAAGLYTAWIRRGRVWPEADPMPDLLVDTFAEAATLVLQRQCQ
jgi:putative hydrolase of the HAD superfamily